MSLSSEHERLLRASNHVHEAARPGQDDTHKIAEALTDIRMLALHKGVSFSQAIELARTKFIYDRVKAKEA